MALFDTAAPLPTLTPESVRRKRLLAEALLKQGMDYSPIASPWQGAARLANALVGGLEERALDRTEAEGIKGANASLAAILGKEFGNVGASAPMAPQADSGAAPKLPSFASDVSGGINAATAKYGLDPSYLPTTAMIESRGNPNAQNPRSSAGGLFQFIDGTAKQYGLTNKFDPGASADAAARLATDNRKALVAALGREPTPAELYLAHQQGAGGAAKLLANPSARAADIVGAKAVQLNGGTSGMTAGEFANLWTSKFNRFAGGGQKVQTASLDPSSGMSAYAPAQPDLAAGVPQPQPAGPQMAQAQQPNGPTPDTGNPIPPQQIMAAASSPQVQQAAQATVQTPQGQQFAQKASGASQAEIIAALSNPWLGDGQKAVLMMILKDRMDKADPMRQLQMLKLQQDMQGGTPDEREMRRLDIQKKRQDIEGGTPDQREMSKLKLEQERLMLDKARRDLNMPAGELIKDGDGNVIGFYDKGTNTLKPINGMPGQGQKPGNKQIEGENKLGDDYRKDEPVQTFDKTVTQFGNIQASYIAAKQAKRDKVSTGAADLAMVYSYMKMLDPGSTVMQGEYANAANAPGVPQALQNEYNRLVGGGMLTDDTRDLYLKTAGSIYNQRLGNRNATTDLYRKKAEAYGYDADRVLLDKKPQPFEMPQEAGPPLATVRSKAEYDQLQSGAIYYDSTDDKLKRKR